MLSEKYSVTIDPNASNALGINVGWVFRSDPEKHPMKRSESELDYKSRIFSTDLLPQIFQHTRKHKVDGVRLLSKTEIAEIVLPLLSDSEHQ